MQVTTGDIHLAARAKQDARPLTRRCAMALVAATIAMFSQSALADEGGLSFWVPGFFGSLAATPQTPGWSLATIYYHTSVKAGADVAFARQVAPGRLNVNFTGNVAANLNADADLGLANSAIRLCDAGAGRTGGGRMITSFGHNRASVDAALTGNLGLGGPGFTVGGAASDQVTGFGDLIPQAIAAMEFRRAQLDDLCHGRHSGRGV